MPYIPTEEVESSNIERIGYHRKQQILRIIFQGDRAYDYPLVTERDYRDLMAAPSKGSFFNRRIKPLYGHRTPREVELVEPCCEHEGQNPTCTEECFPCNKWCCPGAGGASPKQIADAVAEGLRFGGADHSPVPPRVPRTPDGEVDMTTIPDATYLFTDDDGDTPVGVAANDVIDLGAELAKACLHPDREATEDSSIVVCAACGADLSQSGDCPHGAAGQTCETGCGCIPCHLPAAARVIEGDDGLSPGGHVGPSEESAPVDESQEEETNGSSD